MERSCPHFLASEAYEEHANMKHIILAGGLVLFSIGSAGAQLLATDRLPAAPMAAAKVASAEACEAQLWRLAELNKTLGANYNAEHVRDLCAGEQ